tara:strand:- start:1352 stop:1921 length:570 start_codon:yes stop_codon:yes gene_type:complete
MEGRPLILASLSPRRAELLRQIGVSFEIHKARVDEKPKIGERPVSYVIRMAEEKASSILKTNHVSLGADTAVLLGRQIFGKPEDEEHGISMLMALSGRTHRVVTSVALYDGSRQETISVVSKVTFRNVSKSEAKAYWATGEPLDKAGSYAIQGRGAVFVKRLVGSYSAVVGLPLNETYGLLKRFGIECW